MTTNEITKWTSATRKIAQRFVVARRRLRPAACALTAVAIATGLIGCVASGQEGELTGTSSSNLTVSKFSGWTQVPLDGFGGGYATSAPAAAAFGETINLFTRGPDNALWWKTAFTSDNWRTSAWSPWSSLGGSLLGMASACMVSGLSGGQLLAVAGRGTNNLAYVIIRSQAGWGSWQNVGSLVLSDEPAVTWNLPYLYVFANGFDHRVYWSRINLSITAPPSERVWSAWAGPIPNGVLSAQPAAAVYAGTIWVVGRGTNNLYYITRSDDLGSTWRAWATVSDTTTFSTGPAIAIDQTNGPLLTMLNVFGTSAADGHMLVSSSIDFGSTWDTFQDAGGVLNAAPAATSPGNGLIEAFGRGTDNTIYWNPYRE